VRIVVENVSWLCVVPYWAVWPYETLLVPKRHVLRLEDLDNTERDGKYSIDIYWKITTTCTVQFDKVQ